MRAGAKSEVRLAPPIFQIVLRGKAGFCPVGNFVLFVTGCSQQRLCRFIEFRPSILHWANPSRYNARRPARLPVPDGCLRQFPSCRWKRVPAKVNGFSRDIRHVVAVCLGSPAIRSKLIFCIPAAAKNRHGAIDIGAPMHAAGSFQFFINKRLRAETDPIDARRGPCAAFSSSISFGIRFERNFGKSQRKDLPNAIDHLGQAELARANSACLRRCIECHRRYRPRNSESSRRKLPNNFTMIANFSTYRSGIGSKTACEKPRRCGSCSRCTSSGRTELECRCRFCPSQNFTTAALHYRCAGQT